MPPCFYRSGTAPRATTSTCTTPTSRRGLFAASCGSRLGPGLHAGNHHDACVRDEVAAAVLRLVPADPRAGRDDHVLVDDGAADLTSAANVHVVHQDRALDGGV